MRKPRQNEYISHGNQIIPHVNIFMRIGNKFTPTLCWNLHKPKLPKIKAFFMENRATISLRKSAGTPDNGVSSQNAAGTLRILIKITKNSVYVLNIQYLDVRVTMVRCSRLERSRRGKMFYCNICLHPCPQDCYTQSFGFKLWV